MKLIRNIFLLCLTAVIALPSSARSVIDIDSPAMQVFLPDSDKTTGRVVIVCPGGSYLGHAYQHEGTQWSDMFNDLGITAVVLRYALPGGDRTRPMGDVYKAMDIIRSNADAWKVNPRDIGIMGSSAGGHLASTMATHVKSSVRPAFQVLFYPVITMDKSFTHLGSHDNLLGKDASRELEDQYSNEKQVTKDTPRAYIAFSDDDDAVPTKNGALYYLALKENNVPASFFIYPSGGHGWGSRKDFKYNKEMLQDLEAWLQSF